MNQEHFINENIKSRLDYRNIYHLIKDFITEKFLNTYIFGLINPCETAAL